MAKRVHVWVSGLVQGVNFRYYTREEARRLGLAGWVRNLGDGRVEAVFEGEEAALETMLAWCRHGPPAAQVDSADIVPELPKGDFTGFAIRW